jgi:hypothetical protein
VLIRRSGRPLIAIAGNNRASRQSGSTTFATEKSILGIRKVHIVETRWTALTSNIMRLSRKFTEGGGLKLSSRLSMDFVSGVGDYSKLNSGCPRRESRTGLPSRRILRERRLDSGSQLPHQCSLRNRLYFAMSRTSQHRERYRRMTMSLWRGKVHPMRYDVGCECYDLSGPV